MHPMQQKVMTRWTTFLFSTAFVSLTLALGSTGFEGTQHSKSENPNFTTDNKNFPYLTAVKNLDSVDFNNLTYILETDTYKLDNGNFDLKPVDNLGFDKVSLIKVYNFKVDSKAYKLVELEHHYGGGSSNMENHLLAFTITDNSLIRTAEVQFTKAKEIEIKNMDIILYTYTWTGTDPHSSPSAIDRGVFKIIDGDFTLTTWTRQTTKK